jgi:hypothetical protein
MTEEIIHSYENAEANSRLEHGRGPGRIMADAFQPGMSPALRTNSAPHATPAAIEAAIATRQSSAMQMALSRH